MDGDVESVRIPPIENCLSDDDYSQLARAVSPLDPSNNYGLEYYFSPIGFVNSHAVSNAHYVASEYGQIQSKVWPMFDSHELNVCMQRQPWTECVYAE